MTTAQDQQSREAYEDGKWYWVEHEGWHDEPPTIAPACYKANCDSWYSIVFSGIPTRYLKVLEPCEMRAARTLPAPENVRAGEPYDNPAFEDLARTMGVWGTAQAALCAQFFLAGRGAVPAGDDALLPIAAKSHGAWDGMEELLAMPDGTEVYTAAQVLAMGRVPPFETDAIAVNLMRLVGLNKHQARECEEVVRLVLAAAPRPPAAQEEK